MPAGRVLVQKSRGKSGAPRLDKVGRRSGVSKLLIELTKHTFLKVFFGRDDDRGRFLR